MSFAPLATERKNASHVRRQVAKRYQKDLVAPPMLSSIEIQANKNGIELEAARALVTDLASLPSPSRQRGGSEQDDEAMLDKGETTPLYGQRPSYREQLRASGQQALQRVRDNGNHGLAAPKAAHKVTAGAVAKQSPFSAVLAPQVGNEAATAASRIDRQLPFIPISGTPPHNSPLNSPQNVQHNGSWSDITPTGQQSPMTYNQQPSLGFTTPLGGQSSPISFNLCPQALPVNPVGGQVTPTSCCQQEMMAHFMPCVFNGLDGAQIAYQLNAAAPEIYED